MLTRKQNLCFLFTGLTLGVLGFGLKFWQGLLVYQKTGDAMLMYMVVFFVLLLFALLGHFFYLRRKYARVATQKG